MIDRRDIHHRFMICDGILWKLAQRGLDNAIYIWMCETCKHPPSSFYCSRRMIKVGGGVDGEGKEEDREEARSSSTKMPDFISSEAPK